MRRLVRVSLCLLVVASMGAGCHVGDMQFVQDRRLSFTSPDDRAAIDLPVVVRWVMDDFTVVGPGGTPEGGTDRSSDRAGYFAVFLDRTPVGVGKTLKAVAADDPACEVDPRCPDAAYLEQQDVYTTTQPEIRFDTLPQLPPGEAFHTLTVILLDPSGHRVGESAWKLQFRRSDS